MTGTMLLHINNMLPLSRQAMFAIDPDNENDMLEGGAGVKYSTAVVSDGMMFKKAVLTPEEIRGRRTQQVLG
jgi:hypothetical protein